MGSHIGGRLAAQVGDSVGLYIGVDIQFAAHDAALGGNGVGGWVVVDLVEADALGVIEQRVLDHPDIVAQPPGDHLERAVAHEVTRLTPRIAPLFHHVPRHREHGGVLGDLGQVGGRMVQRQLKGVGVQRLCAQRFQRHVAAVHGRRVLDEIEQVGIFRRQLGIQDPPQGEDEVIRGQGLAIRPFGVAQVEGPD